MAGAKTRPRAGSSQGSGPSPVGRPGLVGAILFGNALQAIGIQLFIPILPIYLNHRGATTALIGLVIAAGIAGYGLSQYPAGLVADRLPRRAVAITGLMIYGAFYLIYLLPLPVAWLVAVRFLHAASGGLYTPAAAALLADMTPLDRRGQMFGMWQATGRVGLLIGPVLGGIVAAVQLSFVFVSAGALVLLSALPLLTLPRDDGHVRVAIVTLKPPAGMFRQLAQASLAGGGPDWVQGTLATVWSIYLLRNGVPTWEVGLSFSLFALPSIVLGPLLGKLADRSSSHLVLMLALVATAGLAPLVAFTHQPALLLALAAGLGATTAASRPVIFGAASRIFDGELQARAQGGLQMGLFVMQSAGALLSGWLFVRSPLAAFAAISVVCLLGLPAARTLWRQTSS